MRSSYTFGVPILFQYCNVIYLVGAAWLPLGMHAIDRWVRLGRFWGLWELAGVLAMQVLGGDPETAYLSGLAGAGYALGLAWARVRARKAGDVPEGGSSPEESMGPNGVITSMADRNWRCFMPGTRSGLSQDWVSSTPAMWHG